MTRPRAPRAGASDVRNYTVRVETAAKRPMVLETIDAFARLQSVRARYRIVLDADFTNHATVADGASELLRDVLSEETVSSRIVIVVASLPLGSPVELEVDCEVKP